MHTHPVLPNVCTKNRTNAKAKVGGYQPDIYHPSSRTRVERVFNIIRENNGRDCGLQTRKKSTRNSCCVASYVIFTLIPPPRLRIKLSEVAITFTCSIPMSVVIPCHLSLQFLPTVAYTGYTAACIVAYVLYVHNWQLAVMNRMAQGRSIQCIVTPPLIRNF